MGDTRVRFFCGPSHYPRSRGWHVLTSCEYRKKGRSVHTLPESIYWTECRNESNDQLPPTGEFKWNRCHVPGEFKNRLRKTIGDFPCRWKDRIDSSLSQTFSVSFSKDVLGRYLRELKSSEEFMYGDVIEVVDHVVDNEYKCPTGRAIYKGENIVYKNTSKGVVIDDEV